MKKASSLLVPALLLGLSAAIVQSCASGETDPAFVGPGGSGGDDGDGDGGVSGDGSGGKTGSGGSNGSSGGAAASSGGATGTATGGAKSGGATGTATGGIKGSGGSGGVKSGGTTGTASGGIKGSGGSTTSTGSGGTVVSTSSGGSTGSTTCTKQDSTMTVTNGMATNGMWSGYAYTYIGSTPATVTPDCSKSTSACFMTAAKQLCVSGMVGPDTSFGASAGFGWDIGGTGSSGAAGKSGTTTSGKPAIAPGGTGLAYNIPGLNTTMRLQIEDAAGNDYCAAVTAPNTGTIPWGSFTEKCYDPTPGTAYSSSTKIASVQVVIPTTSGTAANNFCFCVVSLGPAS